MNNLKPRRCVPWFEACEKFSEVIASQSTEKRKSESGGSQISEVDATRHSFRSKILRAFTLLIIIRTTYVVVARHSRTAGREGNCNVYRHLTLALQSLRQVAPSTTPAAMLREDSTKAMAQSGSPWKAQALPVLEMSLLAVAIVAVRFWRAGAHVAGASAQSVSADCRWVEAVDREVSMLATSARQLAGVPFCPQLKLAFFICAAAEAMAAVVPRMS